MGVSVPSAYDIDVDVTSLPTIIVGGVGPVGPVTVDGIPDSYTIDTTNKIDITNLPKIAISIDPLTIEPIDISVRLKEIPSIRAHVPMNYCVGFSLFGIELANVRLCGESQIITEPYRPNPCEICGPVGQTGNVDPTHGSNAVLGIKEG